MKITRVETFLVHNGWRNWLFIKISTNGGISGIGEATLFGRCKTVASAIQELERYLIGKDPFRIEEHWQAMYHNTYWPAGPILSSAISGVEIALWDILGKALGVPVYTLLGGPCRDTVRVYANGWFWGARTPEALAERAAGVVDKGYTGLKFDPFGDAHFTLDKEHIKNGIAAVEAVRAAVGDKVDILIEGHGRLYPHLAIMMARELEQYRPLFYEEPVPPGDINALAKVAARINIPTATGERFYTKFGFREVLEREAADILQPDVCNAGGILECRKIAAMAESYHVPIAPHNPYGPVALAASLQLASCIPNFLILETLIDMPGGWRNQVVLNPIVQKDGYVELPTKPGLGIELDEEAIKKYPYKPADMDVFSSNRRIVTSST